METTSTGWWICSGCGVDVELTGADLTGYEMPCPDCSEPMTPWRRWDAAA